MKQIHKRLWTNQKAKLIYKSYDKIYRRQEALEK